ncbi:MAG: hypothetical protein K1X81_03420 [Bacteroidia bacterium]|nr:hypothetical protein [Bacteroidia bacterium]
MAFEFKNPWAKGGRLSEDWLSSFKADFGIAPENRDGNFLTRPLDPLPIASINFPNWSAILNETQLAGLNTLNSLILSEDAVYITSKMVLSATIDYETPEGLADLLRRVNLSQNRADNVRSQFSRGIITQKPRSGWAGGFTITNITQSEVEQSNEFIVDNVSKVEIQIFCSGTSNTRFKQIGRIITNTRW